MWNDHSTLAGAVKDEACTPMHTGRANGAGDCTRWRQTPKEPSRHEVCFVSRTVRRDAIALVVAAVQLNGCFHYEMLQRSDLPRTPIASTRTRVTTLETGQMEVDGATLEYPTLRGTVRSVQDPSPLFVVGAPVEMDVRLASTVEVRRVDGGRTTLLVVLTTVGGLVLTALVAGLAAVASIGNHW
jgi:hypothetical protein